MKSKYLPLSKTGSDIRKNRSNIILKVITYRPSVKKVTDTLKEESVCRRKFCD